MSKFRIYLGYAIGCISCFIGGMTMGHISALYYHDTNAEKTLKKIACRNDDLLQASYPKYTKNVLKEVMDFYKDEVL